MTSWNLHLRQDPNDRETLKIQDLLQIVDTFSPSSRSDQKIWVLDPSENYTCISMFSHLVLGVQAGPHPLLPLWKAKIPQKFKVFSWIVALNRVNTYNHLQREDFTKPFMHVMLWSGGE
jgi:hypothetical protein